MIFKQVMENPALIGHHQVLTEDDYTDAVPHIIERDFFPDLAQLRVKHELLEARANGDQAVVQELQWKLMVSYVMRELFTKFETSPDIVMLRGYEKEL